MAFLTVLLFEAHQGAVGKGGDGVDIYDISLVSVHPSKRVKKSYILKTKRLVESVTVRRQQDGTCLPVL